MEQRGSSVVEALFSLAVCMLIFTTLLPMFMTMMLQVHETERRYYAHRVAHNALLEQQIQPALKQGHVVYNGEPYDWYGDEQRMCVEYEIFQKQRKQCFAPSAK